MALFRESNKPDCFFSAKNKHSYRYHDADGNFSLPTEQNAVFNSFRPFVTIIGKADKRFCFFSGKEDIPQQ
jgi:hypothetical protein